MYLGRMTLHPERWAIRSDDKLNVSDGQSGHNDQGLELCISIAWVDGLVFLLTYSGIIP